MDAKVNLINEIRQRTEEEELKQYLKSTVGGFTKNSVMEYLTELRNRQHTSIDTFNENMQSVLEEKESLKSENEKLLAQIAQAKAEFMRLAESKKKQENLESKMGHAKEETAAEPEQSKAGGISDKIVSLSNYIPIANTVSDTNDNESSAMIMDLREELTEKQDKLDKALKDLSEQRHLLDIEKQETKKQRDYAAELSALSEGLQDELSRIKEQFSEDKLAKLNEQVSEMTDSLLQQDETMRQMKKDLADKDSTVQNLLSQNVTMMRSIETLKTEADDKENTIVTLLNENVTMMKSMEMMSNSLDQMAVQNEKLLTANNALSQAYQEESRKVVNLINEKSEETVEKLMLTRKLDEVLGSLSKYDLSKPSENEVAKEAGSKTSIA